MPDPAVRLNLYARLLRASSQRDVNDLEEEFEDRFGELPQETLLLLRTTRLQLAAGHLGIAKLEAGPKAIAMTIAKMPARVISALTKKIAAIRREDRLIFETVAQTCDEQLKFFERLILAARRP